MVRPVPAGRRGSCCTPYSRLQEEIDNVETIAVTANNTANNAAQTAQQALTRDTFDDVNVNGDLNVYGDIIQQGAAYETHAQHVFSTDDYIVMRDGALVGLAQGDYSGFLVKKYDGVNDGRLVIDRDGVARVGDVGDEQALATRDESADLTDGDLVKWDGTNLKLIDAGVKPEDLGHELYDEFDVQGENLGAGETQYITVTLSATKTFAAGYDYFIYGSSPVASYVNITSDDVEVAANSATFNVIYQPQGSSVPVLVFRVYRIKNAAAPRVGYVRVNFVGTPSVMDQPKLISGTNIKTINGNSLLGSGDLQISGGGGDFTWRNVVDWSTYVSNSKLTEDVIIQYVMAISGVASIRYMVIIPKGTTVANDRIFSLGTKGNGHILAISLGSAFTNVERINISEFDDTSLIGTSTTTKNVTLFLYTKS